MHITDFIDHLFRGEYFQFRSCRMKMILEFLQIGINLRRRLVVDIGIKTQPGKILFDMRTESGSIFACVFKTFGRDQIEFSEGTFSRFIGPFPAGEPAASPRSASQPICLMALAGIIRKKPVHFHHETVKIAHLSQKTEWKIEILA